MSGTLPARLRCTTMTSMEATAHHEAGHVFMAIYLGARVRSVTIEPDRDDGPDRFGDTQVEWDLGRFNQRELHEKSVLVALAPVGRFGTVDRMADIVAMLASKRLRYRSDNCRQRRLVRELRRPSSEKAGRMCMPDQEDKPGPQYSFIVVFRFGVGLDSCGADDDAGYRQHVAGSRSSRSGLPSDSPSPIHAPPCKGY